MAGAVPPVLGNPQGTSTLVAQQIASAERYIALIGAGIGGLNPPSINPVFPIPPAAPPIEIPSPPTLQPVPWNAPNVPAPFSGTLDIDPYLPEPFDIDPPEMILGAVPLPPTEVAPSAPAVNFEYEEPVLDISLPAPPALMSLSVSKFDGMNLPTFDEEIPTLDIVAPNLIPYTPGDGYSSGLLTEVRAFLLDKIQNGGTGMAPEAEEAIWNRGREREARGMADAIEAINQMESLGYALPPGAFVDARIKVQTENFYVGAGLSREIMIKQAELEVANTQKMIDNVIQLEAKMIDAYNQQEQRAFDASRYATEAGISIYNAKVQAYGAYVDAYKAKVGVFEARIRAEIAKVDAYRALIAAEEAKAQINTALVQMYKVQADVALSSIEVFKARVAAIQTKAEIEKTKVAIFGEQVRAFTAKINAYTASVEGFRATVQAEGTKQEAYKSRVQAYAASIDATTKVALAKIEEFKGRISAKSAEWDGYKAQASAEESKVRAIAANNQNISDSYRATVQGMASYNEVMTKQWQVALDQAQRVAEIGVAAAKANGELFISARGLALDAAKVGATISAQLGAAAINSLNYSTSVSYSSSSSFSQSTSNSQSESRNENRNYSV